MNEKFTLPLPHGGARWLLLHECKLFYYDLIGRKSHSEANGSLVRRFGLPVVMYFAIHLLAWIALSGLSPVNNDPSIGVLCFGMLLLFTVFALMFLFAMNRSVQALFDRGDIDILLSSPMPARTLFAARLASITFGVALIFFYGLTPLAHVGLLMGQLKWLGVYPAIFSLSLIASSAAMLLTLGTVKLIGVRNMRIASHLVGFLITCVAVILARVFHLSRRGDLAPQGDVKKVVDLLESGQLIEKGSLFFFPAKALLGSPMEIFFFLMIGILFFYFVIRTTCNYFVRGLQASASSSGIRFIKRKRNLNSIKFLSGLYINIFMKEWRLVLRNPAAMSVFAPLLMIMLAFWYLRQGENSFVNIATCLTYFIVTITGMFMSLIVASEEAPDLVLSSPVATKQLRNAKILAAVLPIFFFMLPVMTWLLLESPFLGVIVFVVGIVAILCTSLFHIYRSSRRTNLKLDRVAKPSVNQLVLELINSSCWTGTVYVGLIYGWGGIIPLFGALLVLFFAWNSRVNNVN